MEFHSVLLAAGGSLVVGLMGGAFGVGGGIFLVPFLTAVLGLRAVEAVGVSLFCVIGTSASSSLVALRSGEANLGLTLGLEPFLMGGAVAAGLVAQRITDGALLGAFALVVLGTGVLFVVQALGKGIPIPTAPTGTALFSDGSSSGVAYRPQHMGLVRLLATAAGVASGLFGIGGGMLTVPLLSHVARVPLRAAAATASLSIMVPAAAAAVVHDVHGTVPHGAVAAALVGILPGGLLGARLQRRLPERLMRIVFAALTLTVAGSMLWQSWSARGGAAHGAGGAP